MLVQDVRNCVIDVADLNQLKWDLNRLQAVDVGEYITQLPSKQRAIAFRLLNKHQATDVFEYLPPDVQEELINSLHDVQVVQIVENMSPDDRAELSLFCYYGESIIRKKADKVSKRNGYGAQTASKHSGIHR